MIRSINSKSVGRPVRGSVFSVVLVALLIVSSVAMALPVSAASSWQLTANQMTGLHGNTGTAELLDGRVLVPSGDAGGGSLTTVSDIYTPSSNSWSQTGSVNQSRFAYSDAITLNNGKVLIAGGTDASASTDYASAELYDPATGQWSYTGSLNTSRRSPVAVKLQDGRVLVASGAHGVPDGNRFLFTAEIYDPATGQWSYTGNLNLAREGGDAAVLLHDGRVMILGGEGPWLTHSPEVELYDPSTGTWSVTGSLPHGVSGAALTVLSDGRVLLSGGGSSSDPALAEAQLFDPSTGSWTPAASMHRSRTGARSILMPDARVLVAGGADSSNVAVLTSEIYNPATNTWTDDAALQNKHVSGKMIQLSGGGILMVGGYDTNGPTPIAELYTAGIPQLRYDALGDSFSSGDGAPPYGDQTCRDSGNSFPIFLRVDHLDLNLAQPHNIACSGAKTDQVTNTQLAQLSADNAIQPVKVVSITVGGNNIDFADTVMNCVYTVAGVAILNVPPVLRDPLATAACTAQNQTVESKIAALHNQLLTVYQGIHTVAPDARILVIGYPDIFPEQPSGSCNFLPEGDVKWLNQKASHLNTAIRTSVGDANTNGSTGGKAEFVDSFDVFQNNTICSAQPWVNPLDGRVAFDQASWLRGPAAYRQGIRNIQATPFHPNFAGYEAWANAIHTYLVNNPK